MKTTVCVICASSSIVVDLFQSAVQEKSVKVEAWIPNFRIAKLDEIGSDSIKLVVSWLMDILSQQ